MNICILIRLTEILAWISKDINTMWDEITYLFPNFEVRAWINNSSHTLLGIWLLIHSVIEVNPFRIQSNQIYAKWKDKVLSLDSKSTPDGATQ